MPSSRIAIYCRKSSESDDKQCLSLPAQLQWALDLCARRGFVAPQVFQEAQSAKTPGRPEFNRLMALVEARQISRIVTWKVDRLARNASDGGRLVFALEARLLEAIETDDGIYGADADSELMLGVLLGFSAKYSKDLSKNIRRGLEEKWRRGEWSSHAPVGYKNLRESADRSVIVVDPVLGHRVQQLFRLAATGNYSVNDLAEIAEKKWRVSLSSYRKDARKRGISPSAIHRILRNSFYYGAMRVKGQLYAGSHPPLVSKDLFDRVQAILTKRRTTAPQPHKYSFAFSGLIRCSGCGRRLVGYMKRRNGREYRYYACSKHLRGQCMQPQLGEPMIRDAVTDVIAQLTISRDDFALIERMAVEARAEADAEGAERRRAAEARLAAINQRRSRLVDLMLDGTLTRDDYDRKQREIAEEQAQATLASHVSSDEPYSIEATRDYFARLRDAAAVFENGSPDVKRTLLREIGIELEARGKEALVHAGTPATIVMNRGGDPLWWWIVQAIRNYFVFHVQLEGLIARN